MAEYLLRKQLEEASRWQGTVHSAGIGALVNHPAEETTFALMLARGIDLGAHRAVQLSIEHLRQSDLVLVMEKHHRQAVLTMDPAARGKTFLLGHWIETEIPDPYRRGEKAHAEALRLIDASLEAWREKFQASAR